ncbi:hypothetical protein [Carboxylicivirga caseinilyticus]|uniref:hypothetical protein n=1 Tax=Carboxylicivirga caseinilyticus TaxID=3417572 RepID=UPI003D343199|nr:hypothetical protein [Marinilabiliaceae bacterium A049]
MKKEINTNGRHKCHAYHPVDDKLSNGFSFFSDVTYNKEQFFIFRYFLKDLIFLSGLFFVKSSVLSLFNNSQTKNNKPKYLSCLVV